MPSLFITGTDTDVGKTIVTRALLQVLTANNIVAVPYKPIACGGAEELPTEPNLDDYASEDNSDVVTLLNSTAMPVGYREINSYTFIHSSTPVLPLLMQFEISTWKNWMSISHAYKIATTIF